MDQAAASQGVANLKRSGRFAQLGIYVYLIATIAVLGLQAELMFDPQGSPAADRLAATIDQFFLATMIFSALGVALWIFQAHLNLRLFASAPQEFTPVAAVGWFFVPVANLVMPFKAMAALWHASYPAHEPRPTRMIHAWWACFIIGGAGGVIAGNAANLAAEVETRLILLAAFDLSLILRAASAILLHRIINGVVEMQDRRLMYGAVLN